MQSMWMLVAGLGFACMGVCVKLAADTFSATEIVFYRSLVAVLSMAAIVAYRRVPLRTRHWRAHLLRSGVGFVSLLCFFNAIALLPLATAMTFSYTSPLFLAVALVALGKAPLRLWILGALVGGFAGVVLLLRPTLAADQVAGAAFGMANGLLSALAYYNVRELGELGEPEERTVFYFAAFTLMGSAVWMAMDEFHPVDLKGAALLLGVGVFATAAQLAMTRAYKRGNTLAAASLAYSTVVFASIFGMLLWRDTLSFQAWLSIGLIVASGLVTTWFSRANPAEQD